MPKYQAYDVHIEHLLDTDSFADAVEAAVKGEGFVVEGKIVWAEWGEPN